VAHAQAIGRSRGGRTTKIHAVIDGRGRPIAFTLTPGQRGDAPAAPALLDLLPAAALCIADAGYDSGALRQRLLDRGTLPVIPTIPPQAPPSPRSGGVSLRNLIERAFCRLKDWRRIATGGACPRAGKAGPGGQARHQPCRRHRHRHSDHLVDLIESRA
jgi:transposase